MKRIVYVTTEVTPFVASGGLGDVLGALPCALRRAAGQEVDVGVILPLYRGIGEEWRRDMRLVHAGELSLSWRRIPYAVYALDRTGVTYYFVDNPRYFDRPVLYGEYDDGERFAFFCRAVTEFLLATDRVPHILHANDWQSALSVIYPRTVYAGDGRLSSLRTVFTIHNIAYQGRYDPGILSDVFDIHPAHRAYLLHEGCINLMAGAIRLADCVTTVSPRYAEEICGEPQGEGLSSVLLGRSRRPLGILNGLDCDYFSPSEEGVLAAAYTAASLKDGKAANKRAVQRELGLAAEKAPLLLMVTRLAEPKGLDLVLAALPQILAERVQFVLLGTGDGYYEAAFSDMAKTWENMRFIGRFDRDLSKKLYAAADLFLMPSRTEPCGLAQMIACRYGAVPIVRATGGLFDSIVPAGRAGGNGFLFERYEPGAFCDTVLSAISLYRGDPSAFLHLQRAAMRTDFGWGRSCGAYLALYRAMAEEE